MVFSKEVIIVTIGNKREIVQWLKFVEVMTVGYPLSLCGGAVPHGRWPVHVKWHKQQLCGYSKIEDPGHLDIACRVYRCWAFR